MAEVSKDTGATLRFEFYKSVLTFALATLGGEVTLLHTLFSNAGNKWLAYVAIVSMTFACVFTIGAKEVLIRRVDPLRASGRLEKALAVLEFPPSTTVELVMQGLAGSLYGTGLVFFVAFVFIAQR